MWTAEIYEKGALPPALAMLVVLGATAALIAGIALGLLRARKREALAALAEASIGNTPPRLAEGADVVLAGVVRHYEDHDVAVKVAVRQSGSEQESSGSWSHSWVEIDREIVVAPFLLELADGQLVLVHPPRNVDVADALDQKVWIDRNQRVLSAELVPGERIFARGRLERSDRAAPGGAYRDVAWGWALVPADGQMLLSSEPLGLGLRARAAFHRSRGWIALLLLLATQLTLVTFYDRLAGHTEVETVRDIGSYETTDSDGDTEYHHAITVRGESIEVSGGTAAVVMRGSRIPIRIGRRGGWTLGAEATLSWWHGLILAGVAGGFWISYGIRRRASRPWFRRRVDESGPGRLPDPPGRTNRRKAT